MRIVQILVCLLLAISICGQSAHKLLRKGDSSYDREEYMEAEESYRKALEKESSLKGSFNLGNTVYQQQRYDEAIQYYETTANQAQNDVYKADAFYNLGNAQLQGGQIEEAITSYKKAMKLNGEDREIRKNLFLAKMMERQQQQQQQQQQQEQENQENNEEENQNNEEQQQNQNQSDQQNQQEQSDINNQGQQDQEAPQKQELSMEDALKLLQVIENEEKNVQEKLRKVTGNKKKPKKDW